MYIRLYILEGNISNMQKFTSGKNNYFNVHSIYYNLIKKTIGKNVGVDHN